MSTQAPKDTLAQTLATIDQPDGTFATRRTVKADGLSLRIKGVGEVPLPITEPTAERLRKVAQPAPFGLGTETLHDASVRHTWQVAKSRVALDKRAWDKALAAPLEAMRHELGLPEGCHLMPVLDKLLIYERGQFFRAHQDSERSDDMVGSLVVLLPGRYSGGTLTVEHKGERKVFRRTAAQDRDIALVAFYADCFHEVSVVKSGYRVALSFHLTLRGQPQRAGALPPAHVLTRLSGLARAHFETPVAPRYARQPPSVPQRLVYLLDHQYSERSLSWARLKASDGARAATLNAVAAQLGGSCRLALAVVHEQWQCEEEYGYGYGYGRRRSRSRYRHYDEEGFDDGFGGDFEDDGSDGEYKLVELCDSSVSLLHWLAPDDEVAEPIGGAVQERELCFSLGSSDLSPFEQRYEGYQGNYGNTLERWYRRAAVVLWLPHMEFALRAEGDPRWAVRELAKLPAAADEELNQRVATLTPEWGGWVRRLTRAGAEDKTLTRFVDTVFEVATRITDPEQVAHFIQPLGLRGLCSAQAQGSFAQLVGRHGAAWAMAQLQAWQRDPWRVLGWRAELAALTRALLREGGQAATFAAALVAAERATWVAEHGARIPTWLGPDVFRAEAKRFAQLVSAASLVADASELDALWKGAAARGPLERLALVEELALNDVGREQLRGSALAEQVHAEIRAELARPARAAEDWSIAYAWRCACADCKRLSDFLKSTEQALDWPLAKERRQHVHGVIDGASLPVAHTTLRRGSPHVLQLKKQPSLAGRERTHAARLQSADAVLTALAARSKRARV